MLLLVEDALVRVSALVLVSPDTQTENVIPRNILVSSGPSIFHVPAPESVVVENTPGVLVPIAR